MLLHASHNLWIQSIFDPRTTDTGRTKFVIGEFGVGLAIAAVVTAYLFWCRRNQLSSRDQPSDREALHIGGTV
jgi:CAAX protease family protein